MLTMGFQWRKRDLSLIQTAEISLTLLPIRTLPRSDPNGRKWTTQNGPISG